MSRKEQACAEPDSRVADPRAALTRWGPHPSRRKHIFFWLKLFVSGGLIGWIVSTADLAAVRDALADVDLRWLCLAMLLQFLGAALIALRWQKLLCVKDVRPGFFFLLHSVIVASFFRQFLPSIIGGDAIRGYDAWRAGASSGLAVMSLVVDRLSGLLALAVFALSALAFFDNPSESLPKFGLWILLGFSGLLAITCGLFLPDRLVPSWIKRFWTMLPKRLVTKLEGIARAVRTYEGSPSVLAYAVGVSVLLQINVITFYWVLAQALGLDLDYRAFYIIVPIAIFVMMAPITINGVGLREAIFLFLLGLWSIEEPLALAFAWLEYGSFLAFGLIGGAFYALRRE